MLVEEIKPGTLVFIKEAPEQSILQKSFIDKPGIVIRRYRPNAYDNYGFYMVLIDGKNEIFHYYDLEIIDDANKN